MFSTTSWRQFPPEHGLPPGSQCEGRLPREGGQQEAHNSSTQHQKVHLEEGGGVRGRQHTRPQKDLGGWSCGPMHCPCKHNRSQFCDFHAHFSGHNAEPPPPATEHKGKLADLSDANTDDEGAPAAVCSEAPQNSKRGHKLKTECRENICSTHLVLTAELAHLYKYSQGS